MDVSARERVDAALVEGDVRYPDTRAALLLELVQDAPLRRNTVSENDIPIPLMTYVTEYPVYKLPD